MSNLPPPPPPPPDSVKKGAPPVPPPPKESEVKKTSNPRFAGLMLMTVAILAILSVIFSMLFLILATIGVVGNFAAGSGSLAGGFGLAFAWLCSIAGWLFTSVLAIITMLGGINALKRKKWGLALAGAICSILLCFSVASLVPGNIVCLPFLVGFVFFVLSVVSIILVVISKEEFT